MKRYATGTAPLDIRIDAPIGDQHLLLEYQGEIRFGPPYFRLWLGNGNEYVGPGPDEFYGDKASYSPDGRYVAIERWFDLTSPDTGLVVLDLHLARRCTVDRLGAGFLEQIAWRQNGNSAVQVVVYSIIYYGTTGNSTHSPKERFLDNTLDWEPIVW